MSAITVAPVATKSERKAFIELAYRLNANDPNWVPPLRGDVAELIDRRKNPFFDHADMQLFLATRQGQIVGRISAHIDRLSHTLPPEQGMGPGTGSWGMFEAEDEDVAAALIAAAEQWLREQGMAKVLAPLSLSIWDEPGLLVKGHDHPPTMMMGHHNGAYQGWIEAQPGYSVAKRLLTYEINVEESLPPLIHRIVAAGERNERIRIRQASKRNYAADTAILFDILNDAWSSNWGFVPITDREIAYISKKMKPLIRPDLVMFAEYDGEPAAFMMTLPDFNGLISSFGGRLFPFNWIKLLAWLPRMPSKRMRVPLMGVRKSLQNSRMASQLAFMMIEYIRRAGAAAYHADTAEVGWILEDNQGMIAVADAIESKINREYFIYAKQL